MVKQKASYSASQIDAMSFRVLRSMSLGLIALLVVFSSLDAQEPRTYNAAASMEFCLKPNAQVSANLVRLSDLIDVEKSRGLTPNLLALQLSPSPMMGNEQTWDRTTIESLLSLKGVEPKSICWTGAQESKLIRTSNIQLASDPNVVSAVAYSSSDTKADVQPAAYSTEKQFVANGVYAQVTTLSQRHAISAIQSYLRSVSDADFDYEIQVDVPSEGVEFLKNRSSIVAVSGGVAPWIGQQRFILQTKARNTITNIEVGAIVELPTRVIATNRSLAKDHIISEADLRFIVLPKSSRVDSSVCFTAIEQVVGKQLRRTLATGQPIEANHIGSQRLVDQNDEVEIQVSTSGLLVTTKAKALQGGGLNDLIVVEVLPQRSKVTARIIASGIVSTVAP